MAVHSRRSALVYVTIALAQWPFTFIFHLAAMVSFAPVSADFLAHLLSVTPLSSSRVVLRSHLLPFTNKLKLLAKANLCENYKTERLSCGPFPFSNHKQRDRRQQWVQ